MRTGLLLVTMLLTVACTAQDRPPVTATAVPSETAVPTRDVTRPLRLTRSIDTPDVDTGTASVPLDQIVFDTFGGPAVPLSVAQPQLIRQLHDAIAPIDGPDYQPASAATWLFADDLVVGYVDPDGNPWAYPVRVLNSREIVNDELGGQKVAITYCPLCGSGIVFSRLIDGDELSFSNTSALYENDMVMVDRETGSYWWQVAGEAIVGPSTGQKLQVLPGQTTTWQSWLTQYPQTEVMVRPDSRPYSSVAFADYGDLLDRGQTPFPVSDDVFDDQRLAPSARVVVVTVGEETVAFAADPARTIEAEIGGKTIRLQTDGTGAAVTDTDGDLVESRSLFWFSAVSAYPGLPLG